MQGEGLSGGGLQVVCRFILYSSYIRPIFILYSSYIKPSKYIGMTGVGGWEMTINS